MGKEGYLTSAEMAEIWHMTPRRVRQLCAMGLVMGARQLPNGEWYLIKGLHRPTDRRAYRYRKVPNHLRFKIQRIDNFKKASDLETLDWDAFKIRSAFHLHTTGKSQMTLRDVVELAEQGEASLPKPKPDQLSVLRHFAALEVVRQAVREKRRVTKALLQDIYRAMIGKKRALLPVDLPVELEAILSKARVKDAHPVIQAGDFLNEMFLSNPLEKESIRVGYMMANFLLMRAGYPPIVICRIIFPSTIRYWEAFAKMKVTPVKRRAFINSCVINSVIHSYYKFVSLPR